MRAPLAFQVLACVVALVAGIEACSSNTVIQGAPTDGDDGGVPGEGDGDAGPGSADGAASDGGRATVPPQRIASTRYSTVVLTSSGRLKGWGPLSTVATSNPNDIEDLGDDHVVSITSGTDHFCDLHSDGSVKCWIDSHGSEKAVGFGDCTRDANGMCAIAGVNDATAISAGSFTTCVTRKTGKVACWGRYGNTATTLVEVPGVSDAVQVAVGSDTFVCALSTRGTVSCFGGHASLLPLFAAPDLPAKATALVAATTTGFSDTRVCALLETGDVSCWGAIEAIKTIPKLRGAKAISFDVQQSCALHDAQTVGCINSLDPYGASTPESTVPGLSDIAYMGVNVNSLVGAVGVCAITSQDAVYCSSPDRATGGYTAATRVVGIP